MSIIAVVTFCDKALYRIKIESSEKVTLGTGKKDTVYVEELGNGQLTFQLNYDLLYVSGKKISDLNTGGMPCKGECILLSQSLNCVVYAIPYTEQYDKKFELPYQGIVKVGRSKENHVVLNDLQISRRHMTLTCENGVVHVADGVDGRLSQFGVYLNGKRISKAVMKSGDVLDLVYIRVLLLNSELHIQNSIEKVLLNEIKESGFQSTVVEDEDDERKYRRSPRTREMLPYEKIVLDKPPAKMHKAEKRKGLFMNLLSSGVMIGTSVVTGTVSPALLAARSASLITPVANIAMGKSQSKKDLQKYQEYEAARQQKYGEYIEAQRALINQVAKKQQQIISNENPSPEVCIHVVNELRRTLWERRPMDSDFLNVRLGMGYEKLCVPVEAPRDSMGFQMENEEINDLAKQIIEETRIVDNIPARVNLRAYHTVGIIGERSRVVGQIWNMLVALTTAHFYEDVKIVGFFDEEEKELWNAIRWLPHIWDENKQTRFLVYSDEKPENIERIMEIFHEILSKRRNEEDKGSGRKTHYIFLLGSRKLIDNTTLLRDLVMEGVDCGATTLFAYNLPGKDSQQQFTYLPEQCRFVIDMNDSYGSCGYDVRQVNEKFIFTPDEFYATKKIDHFCRMMASVEYQSNVAKQELPSGISFFQGMGITKASQLDAWNHWSENVADKSLSAPMAVLQNGKQFNLDILQHGPHGLVAGTTGSGKSEFIISWLLSVAANYHPYDVSFVIIDYKGGGLANDLEGIPHMIGKITNIGQNIQRSMSSLQGEVVRRQKIFDQVGIKDIKDYIKGFHAGKYEKPLPRLLLIVDEFAELKSQEPEFLKELVSVARIGRTLGINLVLATQNPSGVVDDQIRSNSNLQICLKVQKPEQSKDVISHTEASQITQPGRAYVRVGADEVFELVQSYWSGAPYLGDNSKSLEAGNQVRIVEATGERVKTVAEEKTRFKSDVTELQVISRYLTAVAKEYGIEKMPCPWLPELPRTLYLTDLDVGAAGFNGNGWEGELPWFKVPIGMYDKPNVQKQGIQMIDFNEEGHYGIYGAPGSGKTTMLMTILASIGKWYSPQDAKIYILDFGSNVMKLFDKMPHVAGVALSYEEERVNKIAEVIEQALEERKKEFAEYAISSLSAYRKYVSKKYPAIILAIDNLIPIFEAYPNYEKFLYRIVSEASSYGIYLVYTANTQNGIKFKLTQNIKSAIAFELSDSSDYSVITGKPDSMASLKIKGRGLFKCGTQPIEFQAALYGQGDGDVEMGNDLKHTFEEMCRRWKQPKEVLIKEIPSNLSSDVLIENYESREMLPIGYAISNAEPAYMNMRESHRGLITGASGTGKSKLLVNLGKILNSKEEENQIFVIDSKRAGLQSLKDISKNYAVADDESGVELLLRQVLQEMVNRQSLYQEAEKVGPSFDGQMFLNQHPQLCIMIDDITEFMEYAGDSNYEKLNAIAAQKNALGTIILSAIRTQDLKENQFDSLLNKLISGQNAITVSGFAQMYDCLQNDFGHDEKIKPLGEGQALLYQQGHCKKIKLPK